MITIGVQTLSGFCPLELQTALAAYGKTVCPPRCLRWLALHCVCNHPAEAALRGQVASALKRALKSVLRSGRWVR